MQSFKIGHLLFWWPIFVFIVLISLLPAGEFNTPYAHVIEDSDGNLMDAHIAADGQWRFPPADSIPETFTSSLLTFEDKRFERHTAFDPLAIARATLQNIKSGTIVSGGSTISMQVIRLQRKGKSRTIIEKIIEVVYAIALEWQHSKQEILRMYCNQAPFGGNVVGLEAAGWRYFGLNPYQLSLGECAALAVLPNAPALVYPGKNQDQLYHKRKRLLRQMDQIDLTTRELAMDEPLPGPVKALPRLAPHLLQRSITESYEPRVRSTLQRDLQQQALNVLQKHHEQLKANHIYNAACLIADVNTGKVLAYVGNTQQDKEDHGNQVDIITARRSSGSILKPILYATMQQEGEILPNTLVFDIPTFISGYSPKNFDLQYDGAVHASSALSKSLNIPAVRMLQQYGVERFYNKLKQVGITTLNMPSSHYGLSLILGGAEVKLWDLAGIYSSIARSLNTYDGTYRQQTFHPLTYTNASYENSGDNDVLQASAIYTTFEALRNVNRPGQEMGWEYFESSIPVAWKTGTSFGFRDAWSVGTTPNYVVAVWAGNADGEGRPGLTGVTSAAPIMFDLLNLLHHDHWFDPPFDEMKEVAVCRESGMLAASNCNHVDTIFVCEAGIRTEACPYHEMVSVTPDEQYRVNTNCASISEIVNTSWFVLPPAVAYYYKQKHPDYKPLPPFRDDCNTGTENIPMQLIYPRETARIFIPKELTGKRGQIIFEVAHDRNNETVFWHLDGKYMGETKRNHQMGLAPSIGQHKLTLVDEHGNILEKNFEVVN